MAEQLQGHAIASETPLVLEVKEMSAGRVVVVVVKPEDASSLPDAGIADSADGSVDGGADSAGGSSDAGPGAGMVAPGGLTP